MGDRTIDSKVAAKEMCEDATSQGDANFKNDHLIKGKNHIIVKSAYLDNDMH